MEENGPDHGDPEYRTRIERLVSQFREWRPQPRQRPKDIYVSKQLVVPRQDTALIFLAICGHERTADHFPSAQRLIWIKAKVAEFLYFLK